MEDKRSKRLDSTPKSTSYKWIIILLIGLLAGGALTWLYMSQSDSDNVAIDDDNMSVITNFDECVTAGYPVMESYPRQCSIPNGKTFTEELTGPVKFSSEKGVMIELNDFQSGEAISSPLTLSGRVPGSWSFEAVFPVVLTDWDGKIITEGQARLTDDWMTDDLVPFEVMLEFETPDHGESGNLILQKDNPSDLVENDDQLQIPIKLIKD